MNPPSGKNGNRGKLRRLTGSLVGGLALVCAFVLPSSAGATTVTFNYTGAPESWTVPYGVTSATFNLYGAQGRGFGPGSSAQGGRGGWARATIPVTANSVVTFRVGGRGVANGGGYNGGGSGGYGGGGATDIRIGGDALADRVLVAGGGGGGGFSCLNNNVTVIAVGGDGGGVNGWSGNNTGCSPSGSGGTSTHGGSPGGTLGQGGGGGPSGGGGGYYGGGGSLPGYANGGPGGGGSSYGPAGFSTSSGLREGDGTATVTFEVTDTRNLFASAVGPGDGFVSSSPAGIDCGVSEAPGHDDCTEAYGKDQPVTVTANPSPGSVFDQWIGPGPCSGNTNPICSTTLNQVNPGDPKIVSARFKVPPVTRTFQYTGEAVQWTMPYGASSATIDLYGAQGGGPGGRFIGGKGGRATATIFPAVGTVFWLRVGGAGGAQSGGFNGGGTSPSGPNAYGGGGATDLRTGNDTIADRILVAGGGGGGGQNCDDQSVVATGGSGGGATGGPGDLNFAEGDPPAGCNIYRATGGTQTQKGSFQTGYPPVGGPQNEGGSGSNGGGGGGGYYGGGGTNGPGGGGSSYGPFGYTTESGVREGNGLATITYTLTNTTGLEVGASGPGDGYVSSEPVGVDCGTTASHNTCYSIFGNGQPVTLTANPDSDSLFNSWGGDCSGTQPTCTVTLDQTRSVTSSFSHGPRKLTVTRPGNGAGGVTSTPAGIDCGTTCEANFPYGTAVTLTPGASTGSSFTGWTGACSGSGACSVTMDQARTVGATFTLQKRTLTLAKFENGSGTVVSSPAGINFPTGATSCLVDGKCVNAQFDYGTEVTLTPTAANGSTFTGWGGACQSFAIDQNCVVTMDQLNTAEAGFVLQKRTLEVAKTGSGTGGVTSATPGIDCGSDCSNDYDYGTEVTLNPTPGPNSLFTGWSGACTGTAACVVTLDQARQVTASFALEKRSLGVTRSGNGSGTVMSQPAGVACGGQCEGIEFDYGTEVTLSANPATSSDFSGWTGDCSGSGSTCIVTLDQARSVEATFTLQKRTLTVETSGTGSGTVGTDPAGPDFDFGTPVTLEAVPANGSTFTGWGGDCSGIVPTCTVDMSDARSVEARFTADPLPDPAPVIGQLRVAPRKVPLKGKKKSAIRRQGPAIRIRLSEASTVRFSLKPKPGKARNFRRKLKAGISKVRIPAGVRKLLRPGRFQLTAVATDNAGQSSNPRRTGFRVIR